MKELKARQEAKASQEEKGRFWVTLIVMVFMIAIAGGLIALLMSLKGAK